MMISVRFHSDSSREYSYRVAPQHEPFFRERAKGDLPTYAVIQTPSDGYKVVRVVSLLDHDNPNYKWVVCPVDDTDFRKDFEDSKSAIGEGYHYDSQGYCDNPGRGY